MILMGNSYWFLELLSKLNTIYVLLIMWKSKLSECYVQKKSLLVCEPFSQKNLLDLKCSSELVSQSGHFKNEVLVFFPNFNQSPSLLCTLFKGGHLPSVCIAVVHFIEIICCNTEVTNILIVFENRIVSSQPKAIAGSDTLLKRNVYTILLSNTEITFVTSVLHQMILVKFTAAMHTGWRCPFKMAWESWLIVEFSLWLGCSGLPVLANGKCRDDLV